MGNQVPAETVEEFEARIWVGCLGCYNEGSLRGAWLELTGDPEADTETVEEYTREHTARYADGLYRVCEEFLCLDHEGLGLKGEPSPWEAIERAAVLAAACEELPGVPARVVAQLEDPERAAAGDVIYHGEFDSFEDLAREWLDSTGLLEPATWAISGEAVNGFEVLARYFDYAAYGRDMQHNGVWEVIDGHYFEAI